MGFNFNVTTDVKYIVLGMKEMLTLGKKQTVSLDSKNVSILSKLEVNKKYLWLNVIMTALVILSNWMDELNIINRIITFTILIISYVVFFRYYYFWQRESNKLYKITLVGKAYVCSVLIFAAYLLCISFIQDGIALKQDDYPDNYKSTVVILLLALGFLIIEEIPIWWSEGYLVTKLNKKTLIQTSEYDGTVFLLYNDKKIYDFVIGEVYIVANQDFTIQVYNRKLKGQVKVKLVQPGYRLTHKNMKESENSNYITTIAIEDKIINLENIKEYME